MVDIFYSTSYILIKFDMPSVHAPTLTNQIGKDQDFIRYGLTTLHEYDDEYAIDCKCKEQGEFVKNAFSFQKPMSAYVKKRVYKNYGVRL